MAEQALDRDGITRFVDVLHESEAIRFGDFVTKSGRPTPYFINFGQIESGSQLARLAECYADGIERLFDDGVDILFGPAYKGIPLAVATAVALHRRGIDVAFSFDRKEAKDHGEGGMIVGRQPQAGDRVVILEDVTTAGTSLYASIPLLRRVDGVDVVGVLVGVDRLEHAEDPTETALDTVGRALGVRVAALATVSDVAERLAGSSIDEEGMLRIRRHLERFGAQSV